MPASTSPTSARQRVVDHDERLAGQFPQLALAIHTAVTAGRDFDDARGKLHEALSDLIRVHTAFEERNEAGAADVPAAVALLVDASAAQWRFLLARVDELAKAATGLDAVSITRTLYAVLNLHLDLERRILHALPKDA